jgi:two-component system, NtrC family, response regulator HydG
MKRTTLEDAELKLLKDTLIRFDYNKSKTARYLGVDRKTIYNKIKKYKDLLPKEEKVA